MTPESRRPDWSGWQSVERIQTEYGLSSINLVKPGVGETTRVLLRRVPWRILVRADDLIPRYRLSGGSKLPAADGTVPTMKARWGASISDVLSGLGFIVDMRSGAYLSLGPVPFAVTVRVETEVDGQRKVVSHFNKRYKGELARVLALGPDVSSADGVAEVARDAGWTVEVNGEQVTLVVD